MLDAELKQRVIRALVDSITSGDTSVIGRVEFDRDPTLGGPRMVVTLGVPMLSVVKFPAFELDRAIVYDASGPEVPITALEYADMIGACHAAPLAGLPTTLRTGLARASRGVRVLAGRAKRTITTSAISAAEVGSSVLRQHCARCALDRLRAHVCFRRGRRS